VTIDVVFVIGLSIEVTGAALLAAGVLTRDPSKIATRGMLVLGPDEPAREAQRESARAIVGFGLLAIGVLVQLVGYAADGGWWLLVIGIEVIVAALLLGVLVADGPVTSWLHRQAVKQFGWMREAQAKANQRGAAPDQ
jgi:hypothetical protein